MFCKLKFVENFEKIDKFKNIYYNFLLCSKKFLKIWMEAGKK